MKFIKATFKVIIGAVFGLLSTLALVPAFAAFIDSDAGSGPSWFSWLIVAVGAVLGVFAPTIRRAFGRGFLMLGSAIFALPLSVFLLSGRVTSDMFDHAKEGTEVGTAIGAGIAGTLMTGAAAFVGFIVGAIFIVIGLVLALGGRREVQIVERKA